MLRTIKTYYTAVKTCDIDDVVRYHLLESSEEYEQDGKKVRETLQNALNSLIPSGDVQPSETVVSWCTVFYVPETTEMTDWMWLKYCTRVRREKPVIVASDSDIAVWSRKMDLFNGIPEESEKPAEK